MGTVGVVVTVGPGQERFLDQCRAALAAQSYRDLRVEEVAWTGDLAGVRNRAVEDSDARFVLLHEASDTLLPDAVAQLAHRLARGPEQMVAGRTLRPVRDWRDDAFAPVAGDDLVLGNRLIDRRAWLDARLAFDTAHGRWPVATLARAHRLLGTGMLAEPVHRDHDRQLGLPFGHLRRWSLEAGAWSAAHLAAARHLADEPLLPVWAAGVLDRSRVLDDCAGFADDTWALVTEASAALMAVADPERVRVSARVGHRLAADERRADLVAWVEQRWRAEPDLPTRVVDGRVLAEVDVEDLPDRLLELGHRETPAFVSLRRLWQDEAGVHLDLVALVRGIDAVDRPRIEVFLHRGADRVALDVEIGDSPEAAKVAGDAMHDHPHGLVRATLSQALLPDSGRWRVGVRIGAEGVTREGGIGHHDHRGSAGQPLLRPHGSRLLEVGWRDGDLHVEVRRGRMPRPSGNRITGLEVLPGSVELTGVGSPEAGVVAASPIVTLPSEVEQTSAGFRARLPVRAARFGREGLAPVGDYALRRADRGPLHLDPQLLGRTPTDEITPDYRVRLRVGPGAAPVLELAAPRGDEQLGASAQRRLQQWYAQERQLDPSLAYFQSFTGQHATDNPLAIQQALAELRPDIRVHWAVADATVPVPPGVTPVLFRSPEWYAALATASWVVTNIELERWFRRRPGQQVLQTWHGNPSKVMGRGLWEAMGYSEHRIRAELTRRRETWTAMVSPTEEMADHYRQQFAYDGEVLAVGHPRDDVLAGPRAETLREQARAELGIAEGQRAVLYAPTWRDELATNYRAGAMPDHLDLGVASEALGDDHVLLVRGHRFHRDVATPGARVLDVTDHPEVNELILAADVGVFDYSSLRFDFGLTRKPMVFLVPDLERYTGGRGFLFPFAESAPGPLLSSTAEVVAAVRGLDTVIEEYADARSAFVERFHAQQDDHSAERVVRAFFGTS